MSTKLTPALITLVLLLGSSALADQTGVRVGVSPSKLIAGERFTVSARVDRAASCTGLVTHRGSSARLARKKVARGKVSWRSALPVKATTSAGTARVTCQGSGSGSARFTIRALPPADPGAGKTVFLLNCGGCHSLSDAGTQGTVSDLDVKKPAYGLVVDRVLNGKGLMPSFKSRLSAKEISDVAGYVSSVARG